MTLMDIGIMLFFVLAFAIDRLRLLNALADHIENGIARIPWLGWLHYNRIGDPLTWVQHAFWTLLIGGIDGALTSAFGAPFVTGVVHGCWIAVVMYVVREGYGMVTQYRASGWTGAFASGERPPEQRGLYVGWLMDGTFDVVLPFVTALLMARVVG